MEVLTRKPVAVVLVLAGASLVLVAGSRQWVSGSVQDAVLGATALHGKGSDIAPGVTAAALVGLASAVAAATSGTLVRVLAACSALLAAALGASVVVSVLADPSGVLGRLAAAGTGRSGTLAAHGLAGGWAWVGLAAMLVMGTGGVGALVGGRRWRGLSGTYDAPLSGRVSRPRQAGQPADPDESTWDQLSRGDDPTAEHED